MKFQTSDVTVKPTTFEYKDADRANGSMKADEVGVAELKQHRDNDANSSDDDDEDSNEEEVEEEQEEGITTNSYIRGEKIGVYVPARFCR